MESDLQQLISEIEATEPQKIFTRSTNEFFELWLDPTLTENLSGNIGAFFIRALLSKMNIDEHHLLRWRLENKYRQYQVLNYYCPECMAETIALSTLLNRRDGAAEIKARCLNGFFIKATLGDSSGRHNAFDRTSELDDIVNSYCDAPQLDPWVLQKRLDLINEFRVHSFDRNVIDGLTFIIKSKTTKPGTDCEVFVKKVLDSLPETILSGSLIAWDVGITASNEYYIIEANFTGFHREYCPGFQTSGYFGDTHYGAIVCAWINNYFRYRYHVGIDLIEGSLLRSQVFYKEFLVYKSVFTDKHLHLMRDKKACAGLCGLICLGSEIDALLIRLIKYFQLQGIATVYYIIVENVTDPILSDIMLLENMVFLIDEHILFTNEVYLEIKKMSYHDRKELCCRKAAHMIKNECVVLC